MRVALDATYSLGENLSGVGIYSREILRGLARHRSDARFLWCYRTHRWLRSWREELPANCRRRLLQEPLAPRAAAVFHGLNQRLPQIRLKRAVSTFHDLFVISGDYSSPEFRRRFEAQARDAAERSERIIAVSEFTARQLQELLGVDRGRIHVIPHGVRFPEQAAREREAVVLHVGAIQKRKNVARLVRAFAALPAGWKLVLAGSLGYGAEEALDEIGRSPRGSDIQVLGWVPDAELQEWYRRASALAFPSLAEGFGIPVLEAMAGGLPVLTSAGTALAEVAGDAALLVDPVNEDEIAVQLQRICLDGELRKALEQRGRRRAAEFTWERAAAQTWQAYGLD